MLVVVKVVGYCLALGVLPSPGSCLPSPQLRILAAHCVRGSLEREQIMGAVRGCPGLPRSV